ncbi:MAG: helix-turn-helix domain-containing protein [Butyrivibrio sp.]|nr:helix-turn-helix domain-containing protein [Butyrivibrio sp.]
MKIYDFQGKKNICGQRLKEARKTKKLSQLELAEEVQKHGITLERDSVSRIELGTRFVPDYELMIFAQILEKDVEWFLS